MINCETCVKTEINNLVWYIQHVRGSIVSTVKDLGIINTGETIEPSQDRNIRIRQNGEWKNNGRKNQCMGNSLGIKMEFIAKKAGYG